MSKGDLGMNVIDVITLILAFIIGMVLFSFANELIVKLPEKKKLFAGKPECLAHFSPRCLFIQLLGGVFGVVLCLYFGANLEALTVLLFFGLLTIITFIDIDTMEIPFVLNVCILVLGVISIFTRGGFSLMDGDLSLVSRLIGMVCISLPLFIIVLIIPDGFGGGDIKLMFAAGFFMGWKATVIAFFIGLIIGGCQGIVLLVRRKAGKDDHFAFGPALAVGLAAAVFVGVPMMDKYIDLLRSAFIA